MMDMTHDLAPHWNESPSEYRIRHDAAIIRGPVEWSWDVTSECTGRCLHCFNRSGTLKRDELTDEEMIPIAHQIAEFQPLGICFCGGEPLLRLDMVCRLASIIWEEGGTSANLVTNGMLMTEQIAKRLKQTRVMSIQVSLDGSHADTHEKLRMVQGSFEKAVNAIKMIRNADINAGVAFSPTRFNVHEFHEVFELCKSLGVNELRIQPLMPLGECNLHADEIIPSNDQYDELIMQYKLILNKYDPSMKVEWGDPVDHLIRFGQYYIMVPYTLHITSDGFLVPTVYLPIHLGNVRRHRLDEYWKAGLNTAWQVPIIREMAYRIRCNQDFRFIRPHPYFDAHIDYDLIDRTPKEKEIITNTVLSFIEKFDPFRNRPVSPWNWEPQPGPVAEFKSAVFGKFPAKAKHFKARKPTTEKS